MNELPASLADPLHLLNPYPYAQALAWLAAATLLFLGMGWWRRRRRRRVSEPPPVPPPAPPPRPPASGIVAVIDEIRRRYRNADVRQGCHRLAEELRSHYEAVSRRRLSTLTAREIMAALGDTAVGDVFDLLADLQFRRRRPSREEFGGACDLATEVVSKPGTH